MIRGSRCCGVVAFELSAPPQMLGACHCSLCRKTGTGRFALVRATDFRWVRGADLLAAFVARPPDGHRRLFCPRCGTTVGGTGRGRAVSDQRPLPGRRPGSRHPLS